MPSVRDAIVIPPELATASSDALERVRRRLSRELHTEIICHARLLSRSWDQVPLQSCCYFVLTAGEHRAVVELGLELSAALLDRLAGGRNLSFAPSELSEPERAGLSYLALAALQAIHDVLGASPAAQLIRSGIDPRLISFASPDRLRGFLPSAQQQWITVEIPITVGQMLDGAVRIFFPAAALQPLSVPHDIPLPYATADRRIEPPKVYEAALLLETTELTATERAALSAGQCVAIPGLTYDRSGFSAPHARLQFPHIMFRGSLAGGEFRVVALDDAKRDGAARGEHSAAPAPPLTFDLELARFRVDVTELHTLTNGSILPLHIPTTQAVTLLLRSRPFGSAELTDHDGGIAARLVSIYA